MIDAKAKVICQSFSIFWIIDIYYCHNHKNFKFKNLIKNNKVEILFLSTK